MQLKVVSGHVSPVRLVQRHVPDMVGRIKQTPGSASQGPRLLPCRVRCCSLSLSPDQTQHMVGFQCVVLCCCSVWCFVVVLCGAGRSGGGGGAGGAGGAGGGA
eukprot:2157676-Alexandrium_andersonii.AAC.1